MLGRWKDHLDQLEALERRLTTIYTGRKSTEGDSRDARNDLMNFFERSESLRDWAMRALGDSKGGRVDAGMKNSLALSLAHDIVIKIKHEVQSEKPWSGAVDAAASSQSVVVQPATIMARGWVPSPGEPPPARVPQAPTTSMHQWTISYTLPGQPTQTVDALALAREVVSEWKLLLKSLGLL